MSAPDNFEGEINRNEAVASFDDSHRGFLKTIQHVLHQVPALVPLVVLLLSVLVFGILIDGPAILHRWGLSQWAMDWGLMDPDISERRLERFRFLAPRSLTTILAQVQIVGILAVAQSLVVLTAGIDLSVGAIMIFSSVIMGQPVRRCKRLAVVDLPARE